MLHLETYNVVVVPGQRLNTHDYSSPLNPCQIPTASTYMLTIYASRQAWVIGYWTYGRFIEARLMGLLASILTPACYLVGHMQEL